MLFTEVLCTQSSGVSLSQILKMISARNVLQILCFFQVAWIVSGAGGADFLNNAGALKFLSGEKKKQFSITINDGTVPELDEVFTVSLVSANGGGDIDPKFNTAKITIR